MVLSRGNTEELGKMYEVWRGSEPTIEPMLKYRGLLQTETTKTDPTKAETAK
jgi:peptidyl-dipeptidase Dcp